jgi:hypothetical protein
VAGSPTARRLRWALVVLVLAAVVLVAYTGYQALQVKSNLQRVADDFTTISRQLTSGDQAGARARLHDAQQHARSARRDTTGPGWWLARRIPVLGRNAEAVGTVADVSDDLASRVLPDVVAVAHTLRPDALRPVHGRVDLAPLSAAAPQVVRADRRLTAQSARVHAIDPDPLAPQIASPVRVLQRRLADAVALSDRLSRAVRLLPPMLGADGRRSYLLMFQNNAEARSTGGIPGSFALVTADHGKVGIERQADAQTIGGFDTPPIPLTAQERALFGPTLGLFPQDVNFTPDFPRSAKLLAAMWRARQGGDVDGVLSADPVALAHVLEGTGPVPVADGRQLTARNAVPTLLSGVYADIADPQQQNAYFESVARSVFGAVASGRGNPAVVLSALATSVDEHRLLLWSSHPDEQALIDPTGLSGDLRSHPAGAPQVGVFLDDGGASKLDYYLDYDVDIRSPGCRAQRQLLVVTLHLRSRVPRDTARLPDYVANNAPGLPRGRIRLSVFGYAPHGGDIVGSRLDGRATPVSPRTHDGHPVAAQTVDVPPGGRRTLTWFMVSGRGQLDRASLRVTPGVHTDGVGTVGPPAC